MKYYLPLIISLSFLFIGGLYSHTFAANVSIEVDREYYVRDYGEVEVSETRRIINNTNSQTITKKNNSEVFSITALFEDEKSQELLRQMSESVIIRGEGKGLEFETRFEENTVFFEVDYPVDIFSGGSYTFTFNYTNLQLASHVGALTDIYIQSFAKDFQFVTQSVEYKYNTKLIIEDKFGPENFVSPKPIESYKEDGKDVYIFSQEQLVENYVWVQRGKVQNYKFKITQNVPATEEKNNGNRNEFRMIIPRDFDGLKIEQRTFFTNISPSPQYVEKDQDGNLVGVFLVPSHNSFSIVIEGYATVSVLDNDPKNSGTLSQYPVDFDPTYLSSAQYWEVESEQIQSVAKELKGDKDNVFDILSTSYDFIVDSIDYSEIKRFGINKRQGALATLNGGAAVCMEYSDLYITLLRSQGIPSRAAFGYAYDSKEPSNQQELHQWVQAYVPINNKWLDIDPTWGENGPSLIGGDMNHFLTHVASKNPNEPSTLSGKTFGEKAEFDSVDFLIEVLENLPTTNMMDNDQILQKYQKPQENNYSEFVSQVTYKVTSGAQSIVTDGIDVTNSSQLIVFSIVSIGGLASLLLLSTAIKLVRR